MAYSFNLCRRPFDPAKDLVWKSYQAKFPEWENVVPCSMERHVEIRRVSQIGACVFDMRVEDRPIFDASVCDETGFDTDIKFVYLNERLHADVCMWFWCALTSVDGDHVLEKRVDANGDIEMCTCLSPFARDGRVCYFRVSLNKETNYKIITAFELSDKEYPFNYRSMLREHVRCFLEQFPGREVFTFRCDADTVKLVASELQKCLV
jgi:hypothetical protein